MINRRIGLLLAIFLGACPLRLAAALNFDNDVGAPSQREEVFEFTAAPAIKKTGPDRYQITFAVKGRCDVAVDIIAGDANVVRHLAAGVLGTNAPAPLQKDSLSQTLIWDGKDDFGKYFGSPETCSLRVRLGLKPVLGKILLWHPNRFPHYINGLACDEKGVYVWTVHGNTTVTTMHQPCDLSHIQVYDHDGNYQRTILPLPSGKVRPDKNPPFSMQGQGGKGISPKVPKEPPYRLVLPSNRAIYTSTFGGKYFLPSAPNSFMVVDGMIWSVLAKSKDKRLRFFNLTNDGSYPQGGYYSKSVGERWGQGPCWLAASPDRKWIYISGLGARTRPLHIRKATPAFQYTYVNRKQRCRHAVFRVPYDLSAAMSPLIGNEDKPGGGKEGLKFPEGMAVDNRGRLYVADSGNDRIAIFDAAGAFLKAVPVPTPYGVKIHPKTGDLYVASYPVAKLKMSLVKFAAKGAGYVKAAEQAFKIPQLGPQFFPTLCLDSWAEKTTIWFTHPQGRVQLWIDEGDRFSLKRDLFEDLNKDWKGVPFWNETDTGTHTTLYFGNLIADPQNPYLYLGNTRGGVSIGTRRIKGYRVNTETGALEHSQVKVSAFGYDGLAYARLGKDILRYDPNTWRPVAFDYGDGAEGRLAYQFCSTDGTGFGVSPNGDVIFNDRWPPVPGQIFNLHVQSLSKMKIPDYMRPKESAYGGKTSMKGYKVRPIFPGGLYRGSSALLLYDRHGQLKSNSVIEGLPRLSVSPKMDIHGAVYVGLPMAKLVDGKPLMGYVLAKFPAAGGRIVVNGPGVPVPLKELPKRPADFKPLMALRKSDDVGPHKEQGYGDKAWGEGMLWSVGGFFPFNTSHCVCMQARFDLDAFGRSFYPQSHRHSVAVVDTNGNFILRVGGYGNADDKGPEIRFAHCRYVAVTDKKLFINDIVNKRILSVDLTYEQTETVGVK